MSLGRDHLNVANMLQFCNFIWCHQVDLFKHFRVKIELLFNSSSSFCLVFFQDKHAEEVRKHKEQMELDWQQNDMNQEHFLSRIFKKNNKIRPSRSQSCYQRLFIGIGNDSKAYHMIFVAKDSSCLLPGKALYIMDVELGINQKMQKSNLICLPPNCV